MDTIRIPSPSVLLAPSPPSSAPPNPVPAKSPAVAKKPTTTGRSRASSSTPTINTTTTAAATTASNAVISPATNKPKQSKSRNGCLTCKVKRLKCDESKPTCQQCTRRNVQCAGYRKEFKWRPFEEVSMANRSTAKVKKGSSQSVPRPTDAANSASSSILSPPATERSTSPVGVASGDSSVLSGQLASSLPAGKSDLRSLLSSGDPPSSLNDNNNVGVPFSENFSSSLPFDAAGPSPWLSDLFLAGDDNIKSAGVENASFGFLSRSLPAKPDNLSFSALLQDGTDDLEGFVQQSDPADNPWLFDEELTQWDNDHATLSLLSGPALAPASAEMLVLRFDRLTCGILSVKDGASENPWRTLVWPMAKDTPALYHAVFSLAAFHSCKENPTFRVYGMEHMRQSITCMVQGIQNMRTDAALATSLALAFADTWDQYSTRTCIQHLRGAKALVSQVLQDGMQSGGLNDGGSSLERVRFLYNTWLYMDVIARLTSLDECGSQSLDFSLFNLPTDAVHEIDPLMGCAATLFPLIDQAVRLIQRVRRSESNSVALVSQAIELKTLIERWEPPEFFEPPEDPTSDVQHSIQTAHAYRWAILLYLHQAVPEMPTSEPAAALAKRVLILLATVPLRSRTIIIHMFPLLAAGCEAEQEEDRNWVMERWTAIQSRLMLGGVDRCLEVVREVWARRDSFEAGKRRRQLRMGRSGSYVSLDDSAKRDLSRSNPAIAARRSSQASSRLENIEFEKTVRGRLHWVNVMKEWEWEVFIG